jgi:phytanoyl-CoA hydroxylase
MTLSQEQIDFFWANGYLKIGKVLTEAEVETYRHEYDRVFEEANHTNNYSNLASGGKSAEEKRAASKQMLQIINMCERSVLFGGLNYDERFLNIVEDLIGPNIMLFHDQALWKPARTGGAVFWHQDNAYWKCRPATLMSCWLTLDDATRENGAMQVIPGSHLKPVWHEAGKTAGPLVESKVDESKAVVIELPAGGIMFHHCQTLHYTQPNTTDRQRRAFIIHFMQPGTKDHEGKVFRADFSHPVLRTGA